MFICFEGIDGSGKSTYASYFAEQLRKKTIDIVLTREPGGTLTGEALRNIFLHHTLDVQSEIMLAFAARQVHIQQIIMPALKQEKWVLSDRFIDSTYAYQGYGKYACLDFIDYLHKTVCRNLYADCTILFDIDPYIAQERRLKRNESSEQLNSLDVFELQALDFHIRVREGYIKIVEQRMKQEHLYFIVNTNDTILNIQYQLDQIIDKLLLL
jgi:dTMP kinase